MGSRGIYGLYKNGVDKVTYSHGNSYPKDLGVYIVNFIKTNSIQELNQIFYKIILVDEETEPTKEQIEECKKYFDDKFNKDYINNWYYLLRKSQSILEPYKEDLKYMIDSKDFLKSSLYCEWGYIINLDSNELEIYRGFQKELSDNRFKIDKSDNYGYYNCKLLKSVPLNEVTEELMNNIEY